MKILIVHNFYKRNNVGGEDLVFLNEVSSLKKKLGEENVLTYSAYNDDIKAFKLLFNIWFSLKTFFSIRRIIASEKIDIVHVQNYFPLITPSVFFAARSAGVKTVNTLHNFRPWCIAGTFYREGYGICELCKNKTFPLSGIKYKCYRKSFLQSLVAQLSFTFYKISRLMTSIDYFFVLTPFQREKLLELNVEPSKLILKPNLVKADTPSHEVKEGYVFVGRFEEGKGLVHLLNVWRDLPFNFKLTVVGGGEGFNEVVELYASRNIEFKNYLSKDDTLKEISKAKYLVHTSLYYETFGLTMAEAFSVGTPVIGFNIGTRKDFIKDGYNGFICEREDLKETILKSHDNTNYNLLYENAFKSASKFQEETVISEQTRIYKEIIKKV